MHQGAGDLETPAVPATQRAYLVVLAAAEAEPFEASARSLARPPASHAVERREIEHVLAHAEVEIEGRLLEHHADPGQGGTRILGHVEAEDRDPAQPGDEQPGE